MRTAYPSPMPVVVSLGPLRDCRCDTRPGPHPLEPACYRPGRVPVGEELLTLTPAELDDRLEEACADAESGIREEIEKELNDELDDELSRVEDETRREVEAECDREHVAVDDVVRALCGVRSSKVLRTALARVLGVDADELAG